MYTSRLIFFVCLLLSFGESQGQWTTYTTSNSNITDNLIHDVAVDSNNKLWIATGYGMSSFDGVTWTTYDVNNSPIPMNSSNDFYAVYVDNNDHVWLGTDGGYLLEFDQQSTWVDHTPNLFGDISAIDQDQNGNLWVAHQFGLHSYDGTTWTDHTANLPSSNVTSIDVDLNNEVWIGTNMGAARYDNVSQWTQYTPMNSGMTGNGSVETVQAGIGNDMWIGTNNGIFRFDKSSLWTEYNSSNSGLLDDQVKSIVVDTDSIVWIANDAGSMGTFQNNVWTPTLLPFNVSFSRVIIIDNDGYKWLGCSNALIKLNAQGGGTITLATDELAANRSPIHCYPNPSNGEFVLEFREQRSTISIEVFDARGKSVLQRFTANAQRVALDLAHPEGLYIVKVTTPEAGTQFKKVLLR